jgi:hypothetical protein
VTLHPHLGIIHEFYPTRYASIDCIGRSFSSSIFCSIPHGDKGSGKRIYERHGGSQRLSDSPDSPPFVVRIRGERTSKKVHILLEATVAYRCSSFPHSSPSLLSDCSNIPLYQCHVPLLQFRPLNSRVGKCFKEPTNTSQNKILLSRLGPHVRDTFSFVSEFVSSIDVEVNLVFSCTPPHPIFSGQE